MEVIWIVDPSWETTGLYCRPPRVGISSSALSISPLSMINYLTSTSTTPVSYQHNSAITNTNLYSSNNYNLLIGSTRNIIQGWNFIENLHQLQVKDWGVCKDCKKCFAAIMLYLLSSIKASYNEVAEWLHWRFVIPINSRWVVSIQLNLLKFAESWDCPHVTHLSSVKKMLAWMVCLPITQWYFPWARQQHSDELGSHDLVI